MKIYLVYFINKISKKSKYFLFKSFNKQINNQFSQLKKKYFFIFKLESELDNSQ